LDHVQGWQREWGVETRLPAIACPCSQHRRTSLTIVPTGESLPTQASPFSGSGDVVGDVLDLEIVRLTTTTAAGLRASEDPEGTMKRHWIDRRVHVGDVGPRGQHRDHLFEEA